MNFFLNKLKAILLKYRIFAIPVKIYGKFSRYIIIMPWSEYGDFWHIIREKDYLRSISFKDKIELFLDYKYLRRWYRKHYGRKAKLIEPELFSEKMLFNRIFVRLKIFTQLTDKIEAKKYIQEQIGEKYIIPTIKTYDSAKNINYETLPKSFVIKTNHSCGYNIIVKDKKYIINSCSKRDSFFNNLTIDKNNQISKKALNIMLDKALQENYYYRFREWQYKNIKPKILIERYLNSKEKLLKYDYRFFVINSIVRIIQVDNFTHSINVFYDTHWNKLDLYYRNPDQNDINIEIKRPPKLKKMITLAQKLANNFDFVRVDMYNIDSEIFIGELTFTPVGGFIKFNDQKWDRILSKYWKSDNVFYAKKCEQKV